MMAEGRNKTSLWREHLKEVNEVRSEARECREQF